jgi:outer membrane protein TolC
MVTSRALAIAVLLWGGPLSGAPASGPLPLTFPEALARGRRDSPLVATSRLQTESAQAAADERRSALLPALLGALSLTRLDGDRAVGQTILAHRSTAAASLSVSAPIVNPSRWVDWRQALEAVAVSRAGEEETRRQLALAVGTAYYAVNARKRTAEAVRITLDHARANLQIAEQRLAAGAGTRGERLAAQREVFI